MSGKPSDRSSSAVPTPTFATVAMKHHAKKAKRNGTCGV